MFNIKMLPASNGDCFVIEYGEKKKTNTIIIDSGMGQPCYKKLKSLLLDYKSKGKFISLIVLTHYDRDHIDCFLKLFSQDLINNEIVKEIWFNFGEALSAGVGSKNIFDPAVSPISNQTSVGQAYRLYTLLLEKQIKITAPILESMHFEYDGALLSILSPSKEQIIELLECDIIPYCEEDSRFTSAKENDYSLSVEEAALVQESESDITISNKSSIAFLLEYKGKKYLFLGDAVPSQITSALKKKGYSKEKTLEADLVKISHHGSVNNTSLELMELITCNSFLLSTRWGDKRPSKICLSKVVTKSDDSVQFYCNYEPKEIFTPKEMKEYGISFFIVPEEGLEMEVLADEKV